MTILSSQKLKNAKYRFWLQKGVKNSIRQDFPIRDPQLVGSFICYFCLKMTRTSITFGGGVPQETGRRPPPFGRAATGCLTSVILYRVSTIVFDIHSFYNLPIHTQQETTYLIQVQLSFYYKITTTITTTIPTKLHNLNYRTGLTH